MSPDQFCLLCLITLKLLSKNVHVITPKAKYATKVPDDKFIPVHTISHAGGAAV
jgi:hypothetical protein